MEAEPGPCWSCCCRCALRFVSRADVLVFWVFSQSLVSCAKATRRILQEPVTSWDVDTVELDGKIKENKTLININEPFISSGGRSHGGVAVKCSDGSAVYAPFDGKLVGRISPYGNGNKIDNGFKLIGNGLCMMLFYSKPNKYTRNVKKGQRIGTLLPMQTAYPGITSHIQMCDRSNLTCYL
ncbi:leukocyte cell-derived chemotaxin-2-like [Polyodon spathula]|uniref:leukocyte cell-derived chemotaxin-2-like n=1 Tax=Polyodon spathula TaxID=7913 RepID=UPI001B7F3FC7|nr:leukocyte cell-derived chemotaxin-2-like [Polyodon spathula]